MHCDEKNSAGTHGFLRTFFRGRGALHTRGICNLGKINYYLGKKASDDGRVSRYPDTVSPST